MKLVNCEDVVSIAHNYYSEFDMALADLNDLKEVLYDTPAIEAKPVVRAHWIVTSNGEDKWVNKCSACGGFLKRGQKQTNFCPNCGAEMPGGKLKNNMQKADVDKRLAERGIIGEWVKIPVISMEDVPKVMEEMEKSGKPGQNQQKGSFKAFEEGQT